MISVILLARKRLSLTLFCLFLFFFSCNSSNDTADDTAKPGPGVVPAIAGSTHNESFSKAKKMARGVFADHQKTFYCGCSYEGNVVNLESCGYKIKKNAKRAKRLEWEHIVPAHAFGQSFPEWRTGILSVWTEKDGPSRGGTVPARCRGSSA